MHLGLGRPFELGRRQWEATAGDTQPCVSISGKLQLASVRPPQPEIGQPAYLIPGSREKCTYPVVAA